MGSLTDFSREMAERYNLKKACEFIGKDFPIRNAGEELRQLIEKQGTDKYIVALEKEFCKSDKDYIGKWFRGERGISKESAGKIFLTLEIYNVAEAEHFIRYSCWEDGFYERDYKDIIYMFCIKNGCTVKKMKELIEKYKNLDNDNAEGQDSKGNTKNTVVLASEFYTLKTEEDLERFFSDNNDYFGNFNRTTYKAFIEYYNLAISDIERYKSETAKKYSHKDASIKELCEEMRNIPNIKIDMNFIQAIIFKDEPDRAKLTNIKNKKDKKIPRKYLILFYMFTNGDDDYQESIMNLNAVLDKCGMPLLDSRNPFDWIVMNSIHASSTKDYGAIDRFKKVLNEIYNIIEEI
jgi:hypothetical protein